LSSCWDWWSRSLALPIWELPAPFSIGSIAIRGGDKAGHFVLLGGLAFTLNRALGGRSTRMGPIAVQLGGLLVALAITREEFSQMWIPSRTFDWGDLAANYAGIACADWLARRWLR
jgi:hypothetical protein